MKYCNFFIFIEFLILKIISKCDENSKYSFFVKNIYKIFFNEKKKTLKEKQINIRYCRIKFELEIIKKKKLIKKKYQI